MNTQDARDLFPGETFADDQAVVDRMVALLHDLQPLTTHPPAVKPGSPPARRGPDITVSAFHHPDNGRRGVLIECEGNKPIVFDLEAAVDFGMTVLGAASTGYPNDAEYAAAVRRAAPRPISRGGTPPRRR